MLYLVNIPSLEGLNITLSDGFIKAWGKIGEDSAIDFKKEFKEIYNRKNVQNTEINQ